MEHDVEEHARFVEAEQGLSDDEMTGTGDGEKFGEALEKAQENGFEHDFQNYKKVQGLVLKLYFCPSCFLARSRYAAVS